MRRAPDDPESGATSEAVDLANGLVPLADGRGTTDGSANLERAQAAFEFGRRRTNPSEQEDRALLAKNSVLHGGSAYDSQGHLDEADGRQPSCENWESCSDWDSDRNSSADGMRENLHTRGLIFKNLDRS